MIIFSDPGQRLSIHFPLTREDNLAKEYDLQQQTFNPLPSHEGRRWIISQQKRRKAPFNPLPSHEGRHCTKRLRLSMSTFNPLPSHEGRRRRTSYENGGSDLSIHFPLTREDAPVRLASKPRMVFQSTSLSRGKTCCSGNHSDQITFQSTSLSRGKTNHYLTD